MKGSNTTPHIAVPVATQFDFSNNPHASAENIEAIGKVINKAVIAQCELNTVMAGADWEAATLDDMKGFNFRRALFVEAAEAIAHTDYKWWAKGETNIGQVYMELVDITHFMISYFVVCSRTLIGKSNTADEGTCVETDARNSATDLLAHGFASAKAAMHNETLNFNMDDLGSTIESTVYSVMNFEESETDFYDYGTLVAAATGLFLGVLIVKGKDYSVESFLNDYLSKSVLNRFRTSMGAKACGVSLTVEEYRETPNSYLKIWRGREDNEWLTEVLEQLDASGEEFSVSRVDSAMREIYMQVTAEALA